MSTTPLKDFLKSRDIQEGTKANYKLKKAEIKLGIEAFMKKNQMYQWGEYIFGPTDEDKSDLEGWKKKMLTEYTGVSYEKLEKYIKPNLDGQVWMFAVAVNGSPKVFTFDMTLAKIAYSETVLFRDNNDAPRTMLIWKYCVDNLVKNIRTIEPIN